LFLHINVEDSGFRRSGLVLNRSKELDGGSNRVLPTEKQSFNSNDGEQRKNVENLISEELQIESEREF
jgi:hypothetical protein